MTCVKERAIQNSLNVLIRAGFVRTGGRAGGHVGIERAKARTSVSAAAEYLIQGYSCRSPKPGQHAQKKTR